MKLAVDKDIKAQPGQFGVASCNAETFLIPVDHVRMIQILGASTAETLYEIAEDNPQRVLEILDWNPSEFQAAMEALKADIEARKPDYFKHDLKPIGDYHFGYIPGD